MKSFVFLLVGLFAVPTFSQTVLLRAPGASPVAFQQFLETHPNAVSFIDHTLSRAQKNTSQEARLFQLGDSAQQDISTTLSELKKIQMEAPLTLISLRYLRDLSEKALEQKVSISTRQELTHIYCKSVSLLNEGPILFNCAAQYTSLQKLFKKYPQVARVQIETLALTAADSVSLAPNTPYQWTLLSNAQKPVSFFGTFEQLMNQQFSFENFVEGDCGSHSIRDLDFDLTTRGLVYFNNECQARAQAGTEQEKWYENRKTWIYTAGALVVGGLVYAMKDKKLMIDASALK